MRDLKVRIPEEWHKEIRIKAAEQDIGMNEYIRRLLKKDLLGEPVESEPPTN